MTRDEAYLMARMQLGLVYEGVLHHPPAGADETWLDKDGVIIREAVREAWPDLDGRERRMFRHWGPNS
jgi:hypothetical protein